MAMNFCPNCGHRIYQHNSAGCLHIETIGHVVKIGAEGFTTKHPLAERENDRLFDCQIHHRLAQILPEVTLKSGEYAVAEGDDGELYFEPPETATEQCACKRAHPLLSDVGANL